VFESADERERDAAFGGYGGRALEHERNRPAIRPDVQPVGNIACEPGGVLRQESGARK